MATPAPAGVTVYPNGVTVDSQGRVDYNVDLSGLPGAVIKTEQGVRTDVNICTFEDEQQGDPGDPTLLFITELSFDPNTCTRQLAEATYPRDALPPSVLEELAESPDTGDFASSGSQAKPGPGALATWSGSIRVNVEDPRPLEFDVTTTKSNLTWNSSGGASHRSGWGWLTATGWSRVSHNHGHNRGDTYASTDTNAHYRNGVFCVSIDTHTYHDRTYFRGYYNGGWYWTYKVRKSGGCTSLLHYEHIVDTP